MDPDQFASGYIHSPFAPSNERATLLGQSYSLHPGVYYSPSPKTMVPLIPLLDLPPGNPPRDQMISVHSTPQRLVMPPGFKPFSPSPPPTTRPTPSACLPPNRRLHLRAPIPQVTRPVTLVSPAAAQYNPVAATFYTPEGRAEATDILVNCCRLAAYHSTHFNLVNLVTGSHIPMDSHIFVREPCRLFCTEMLKPLQHHHNSTAFLTPFQSFMEHFLRCA
jgi:hypothetical protein